MSNNQDSAERDIVCLYDKHSDSFEWTLVTIVCKSCRKPFQAGHLCTLALIEAGRARGNGAG